MIVGAGGDHLHPCCERVSESRAGRPEVESPGVVRTDLVLKIARGAGKDRIGGGRTHHDEPDFVWRQSGLPHRADRRFLCQVGCRHPGIDDVAFLDAGALKDPLVAGVDEPLEIVVGQDLGWHVSRQAGDLDAAKRLTLGGRDTANSVAHHKRSFPGAGSPKYSYARGVATRPRGVRSRKPI